MTASNDRGAGAVLVLMAVVVLSAVAGAVLVVAGGIDTRQRSQAAADLAALAAATHVIDGPAVACEQARAVAQANGAALRTCDVIDGVAAIEVAIGARVAWLRDGFVGRARAGPVA